MRKLLFVTRNCCFLLLLVTFLCKSTEVNVSAQTNDISRQVFIPTQAIDHRQEFINNTDTYISKEYVGYVYDICLEYNVCPELIIAMIEAESSGDRYCTSKSNAQGLMQIIPKWHMERAYSLGVTDLYDPYSNILVGVDLVSDYAETYKDLPLVLMVYNEGAYHGAVERAENGKYSEYAKKIMQRSSELQKAKENQAEFQGNSKG